MDWLPVALLVLVVYGIAAWYIKTKRIREDIITFYGPVMAIKSRSIGFFDRFRPYATFLRAYGSLGIAMVVVVSLAMTALVFFAFHMEVTNPPPAEGVFEVRNWFVIPGVNQFIPLTIPVLLGIFITIAVHEVGHG
ncbi:MAG: peptidase M50, partial [Methanomicrobiales archaeon]|nr:peptidase M50 [Methanomicrobiales archaeon]